MHLLLSLACLAVVFWSSAATERNIIFVNKCAKALTVTHHEGEQGIDGAATVTGCNNLQPGKQCTFTSSLGHHQFCANNAWKTTAVFFFDIGMGGNEYSILAKGPNGFDFAMEISCSISGSEKVDCRTVGCPQVKKKITSLWAFKESFTVTFCPQ